MATIGDIAVKITADTRDAIDNIRSFTDEIEQSARKVERQNDSIKAFGDRMSGMGQKLTLGITVPFTAGAIASAKFAGDLEQSQIAFETLLGSADKATSFIKDMQDFAKATPFEYMDLQNQAKRLLAYGFAADEILPMLRNVGDASAALGGDATTLESIIRAFGQIRAKGAVSAEEMNQLSEAGIAGWQMIADKIGKTVPEAMKMAEQKQIDAATAISALMEGMSSRYGGLMDKQSQTTLGKFSNLMDSLKLVAAEFGNVLIPVIKPLLSMMTTLLSIVNALPGPFKAVLIVLGGAAAAIGPLFMVIGGVTNGIVALSTAMQLLNGAQVALRVSSVAITIAQGAMRAATLLATAAQWLLNAAMSANPIGLIIIGIVALIAVFVLLWTKCKWFRDFWKAVWGAIKDAFWAVVNFIKEHWQAILLTGPFGWAFTFIRDHFGAIKEIASEVAGFLGDVFWTAVRAIRDAFNWLSDQANAIWNKMKDIPVLGRVLDIAENTAGMAWNLVTGDQSGMAANAQAITSALPSFAGGGLATGPKSGYPVMLHGDEIVTPVDRAGGVTVNVTGNTFVGNSKDAARAITDMVETEMGRDVNRAMRGRFVYA